MAYGTKECIAGRAGDRTDGFGGVLERLGFLLIRSQNSSVVVHRSFNGWDRLGETNIGVFVLMKTHFGIMIGIVL